MAGPQYLASPAAVTGLTVTSGAGAWGFGAWVEVTASSTATIYLQGITFEPTTDPSNDATVQFLFEVGIGAPSAEVTKVQIPYSFRRDTHAGYYFIDPIRIFLPEPYLIPTGTRIAVRITDSVASSLNYSIKIFYNEETTLTVAASASSVHTGAAVVLVQQHALVAASAASVHVSSAIVLIENITLAVVDAASADLADNISILQHHFLIIPLAVRR